MTTSLARPTRSRWFLHRPVFGFTTTANFSSNVNRRPWIVSKAGQLIGEIRIRSVRVRAFVLIKFHFICTACFSTKCNPEEYLYMAVKQSRCADTLRGSRRAAKAW
ncbi:hypothetical protein SCLCIDRAFT_1219333 [Scleroderma citrinum Foug A]|uniref:Uncharacterized protein n=1 Tax=Scleroderma citrinum Foug A TaxID=1036808 RepID=A0A0C3DN59_9AGAM|nr:hypothetical protein SCLCIDRAFT_1219333 [Scleroderma citrinum Foug A]